jgi:hypothetical protein
VGGLEVDAVAVEGEEEEAAEEDWPAAEEVEWTVSEEEDWPAVKEGELTVSEEDDSSRKKIIKTY